MASHGARDLDVSATSPAPDGPTVKINGAGGRHHVTLVVASVAALALGLLACGSDGGAEPAVPSGTPSAADQAAGQADADAGDEAGSQPYPDIVAAELLPTGHGIFDVAVTVSSPYDSPERYADGWRVLAPDGTVLGEHELLHDHASEQPFTRTQRALRIPDGISRVTIEGRDLLNGYGGGTLTVDVPAASAR